MSLKILRVGDPHVKVSNLKESEDLLAFILQTAQREQVQRIEILGDLFHTHAVLRLEVLEFWNRWLYMLCELFQVVVLVGNHDMTGDYLSNSHAMSVFGSLTRPGLHIVDTPRPMGNIGYLPYIHDNAKFISQANLLAENGVKILVCHQTIKGSKYESGMYAPDGVDPDLISPTITTIISGHIHSKQDFGRVRYPGTARWDTASDANQSKGITIYEHDNATGQILNETYIGTERVCSPIIQYTLREGEAGVPEWPANARASIELIGSSAWIAKEKVKYKGKCHIKARITDTKTAEKRSAGKSFLDFLETLYTINNNLYIGGMDRETLVKFAKELGIV